MIETTLPSRILAEARLSLNHIVGRNSKYINKVTAWRWVTKGLLAPDGRIVRLEAVKLGSGWITSIEALERFSAALTPALQTEAKPMPRTPAKRHRGCETAAAELIRRGC